VGNLSAFQDWLHGFPGLYTDAFEYIRFYFLVLFWHFLLLVPCGTLSWLMSAFERTLHSFSYRILSYRIVSAHHVIYDSMATTDERHKIVGKLPNHCLLNVLPSLLCRCQLKCDLVVCLCAGWYSGVSAGGRRQWLGQWGPAVRAAARMHPDPATARRNRRVRRQQRRTQCPQLSGKG